MRFNNSTLLGRNYSILEQIRDCYGFYLGTNKNTLQILALSELFNKWYYYDNVKISEYNIYNFSWLKKRHFLIEKIKDAERFGLIIASLHNEENIKVMEITKKNLKIMSKETYLFNINRINPSKLANFQEVCSNLCFFFFKLQY